MLVIYPGVIPEKLAIPCDEADKANILNKHHSTKQYSYIIGYLNAIESIVSSYQRRTTQAVDDDTVYPLLFFARHAIELSLKYCLNNLITHFRQCKNLPGSARNILTHNYSCFSRHLLMPIFNDIIKLRSFSSPHESTRLNFLRDELAEFDNLDPEATAFRYDLTKNQNQQDLHARQRWIEIDKLVIWTREICDQILEESESHDLELCSSGFYSKAAIASMDRMVAALQNVSDWFNRNAQAPAVNSRSDMQDAISRSEVNLEIAVAMYRINNKIRRKFLEMITKNTAQYAVLGFYTACNGCLMTVNSCKRQLSADNISVEHLEAILERRSNNLTYELDQLKKILAKVEAHHAIKPFS